MESLDSLSDYSESSRNSISLSTSTISIASGFSEYQNEFLQLKDLVTSGVHSSGFPENRKHALFYETQLQNMKTQLRKLSEENSKLKSDIVKTENKQEQLKSAEINKLLLANSHLETSLEASNKQIQRLLKDQTSKHISSTKDEKILILENDNQTLRTENTELMKKLRDSSYDKIRLENDFNNIKTEIAEYKLEYNVNTNCIVQLKTKITEQHIQLEDKQNQYIKLTNAFEAKSQELETTKKMENWYKEQLHLLQKEKTTLIEKTAKNREALLVAENHLESLKLEEHQWKYKFDKLQFENLKEREILLKKIEAKSQELRPISNNENILNSYQTIVKDLNIDIDNLKTGYESQKNIISELNKQKLEADKKFLSLESTLQEKHHIIDNLQEHSKDLDKSLQSAIINMQHIQKKLQMSEQNAIMLTIQLNGVNDDKKLLETTVKGFKEQFIVFKSNYQALNEKFQENTYKIANLELKNEELCKKSNSDDETIMKKDEEINCLKQILDERDRAIINLEQDRDCLKEKVNGLNIHCSEVANNIISQGKTNFYELAKSLPVEQLETIDQNNADFLVISYLNLLQLLYYFFNLIKVQDVLEYPTDVYKKFDNNRKKQYIQKLFSKMATVLQGLVTENISNVQKITFFKSKMKNTVKNIDNLSNRCKALQEKCEHSQKLLEILNEKYTQGYDKDEEIKHVKALLKVKARHQLQQQKRFERNYHVLLRKVKEHMRARSVADKQCAHFQEIYQRLLTEYNTLKTELNSKNMEINSFQTLVKTHMNIENQLKSNILVLNNELDVRKINEDDNKNAFLEELKIKSIKIETLKAEVEELKEQLLSLNTSQLEKDEKIAILSEVKNELSSRINKVDSDITQEKYANEKLKISITEQNEKKLHLESKCNELLRLCEDLKEKNIYYLSELEASKLYTQQKIDEIRELNRRKIDIESSQETNTINLQNLITALKSQLLPIQSELMAATREKHFLQRLCNDLKVALQIHVNHNKVVKEYVANIFKEKEANGDSLPFLLVDFESPLKCNDDYIDNLLDANNLSCQATFNDIQGCLFALRNEINILQEEVFDKNRT